jgi:1-phosphofructokinase
VIVTLTPNPSLDRTLEVAALHRGEVLRATTVRVDAGGKGINVARALRANGHDVRAVVPVGGHEGDHLVDTLAALSIDVVAVPLAAVVRTNVSLVEPDGTVTKINAPGPELSADETAALVRATIEAIDGAAWVAGCGSLPPGAPDDLYANIAVAAHEAGARVAIDTSGPALEAALPGRPDLIKPNADELAVLTGRTLPTVGAVLDAAHELLARGIGTVVVSLGADGALLVDGSGSWHATTPPVTPRSNVGAGDSLVAGLLAAGGSGPDALASGVAYGTAAVQLPGTSVPGPDDLDLAAVTVTEADPDRSLEEPGGTR